MIQKIELGNTGEMVSELSLGAMYFGSKINAEASAAVLEAYMKRGGSFIDTANIYAYWVEGCRGLESETFLGEWFKKTGLRHSVFLATKVGFDHVELGRGLKREQIIKSCEESLRLMKTDYIDLFYAHTDDRRTPLEESLEAFAQLHRQGKVRFIGASNYVPWRMEKAKNISRANHWPAYVCMQQRFTYLKPVPVPMDRFHIEITDDVQDYALAEGLTLLAYSPLLGGYYYRPRSRVPQLYKADFNQPRMDALQEVAEEIGGVSLGQLVLAWMRRQPAPIIPLIAGSTPAQIEENINSLGIQLTDSQLERLNLA